MPHLALQVVTVMEGTCVSCDISEKQLCWKDTRKGEEITGRNGEARTLPLILGVASYLPIPDPNHMGVNLGEHVRVSNDRSKPFIFFMMDTICYHTFEISVILGNSVHDNPLYRVRVCY
jgi:hypothetical protein